MTGEIRLRWIMVKAPDYHVIRADDSIEERMIFRGRVIMPTELACNVPGAVGTMAYEFNAMGRQVWTGKMLPVRDGKIVRNEIFSPAGAEVVCSEDAPPHTSLAASACR